MLKNRYTPYIQVFYHLNCGLWCGYDAVAYAYYSKGHLIVTEPLLNKYANDSLQEKLKKRDLMHRSMLGSIFCSPAVSVLVEEAVCMAQISWCSSRGDSQAQK